MEPTAIEAAPLTVALLLPVLALSYGPSVELAGIEPASSALFLAALYQLSLQSLMQGAARSFSSAYATLLWRQ